MECNAEAVYVGLLGRLCFAILLRGGIARGAQGDSISGLPRFEVTGCAKVDQVEMAPGRTHDVSRLDITKNDRWLARVQVIQHGTELDSYVQHIMQREAAISGFL